MKLIIAGSRSFPESAEAISICIEHLPGIWEAATEVVSGCAQGADAAGEKWALTKDIYIKRFPAQWGRDGLSAGFRRNRAMAEYGDVLLAFWDGQSKGTKHMIEEMKRLGKPVFIQLFQGGSHGKISPIVLEAYNTGETPFRATAGGIQVSAEEKDEPE